MLLSEPPEALITICGGCARLRRMADGLGVVGDRRTLRHRVPLYQTRRSA